MKNKKLLISLTAVFSVFVVIAVFLMIWFWGDRYGDFRYLKNEFAIPDLKSGGSPQGLANYYNGEYEVKTEVTAADGTVTERLKRKTRTSSSFRRICLKSTAKSRLRACTLSVRKRVT